MMKSRNQTVSPGSPAGRISLRGAAWRASLLGLALIFGTVLLASCGGGGGGGEEAAGPITITMWEQMDPEERELQKTQVAALQAAHPEITLEISHYGTEQLRTQYQTAALAGSGPDLVFGPADQVGPFSVMNIIHPVDEIIPRETLQQFRPDAFDTLGGHVYSLPDQIGNHLTLVYNKAIIPEPPTTMGELIEMAKAHTADDNGDGTPDRFGLVFEVMEPFWTIPFLTGYGGWVMDEQYNPTLDSPAMVQALELLRSFKTVHGIMPRECDYELADTMFKEGRAAMIINGSWAWEAYRKAGLDIGLARIPKIEETGLWPAPMISTKGYSVNRKLSGARLERVLKVLQMLTATENQIEYAVRIGTLPTRKEAYQDPRVRDNETLSASNAQVEVGRRMPVVPEMRAIWDVMRPEVQSVWNGDTEPAEAARRMQEQAVRKIAEMKG